MSDVHEILISLSSVGVTLDGRRVLSDVSLDIRRGDFIAVTGPNGGGKTTLLRVILQLLHPTAGKVAYKGEAADSGFRIGYLPQKNKIDSRFPITVASTVELGLLGRRHFSKEQKRQMVADTLEAIELTHYAQVPIGMLSGGQLQRTLLGRAIISEPQLLVIDEPLSYLDKYFEAQVYDIIRNMAPRTTIVLVSHDISTIAQMANRHIIVNHGIEVCTSTNHFLHYNCCNHEDCSHEIRNFAAGNNHQNHKI